MERAFVDSERYFEHDLQFYDEPPMGLVDLEDLEKLLIDRMKNQVGHKSYLRKFLEFRGSFIDSKAKYREFFTVDASSLKVLRMVREVAETTKKWTKGRFILTKKLRKAGFRSFADLCNGTGYQESHSAERYSARRKDHVSHCILFVCMAQQLDMGNWFQQTEVHLFKLRLSALDSAGIDFLLFTNNLNYPTLTEDDKNLLSNHLKQAMKHPSSFDSTTFYEVPAVEILYSIKKSYIYSKGGVAYATFDQLRPAILFHYETRLESRIENMRGALNYMIDPRIHSIMKLIDEFFDADRSSAWDQGVATVDTLDWTSSQSYPPCMRRIHEGLRKVHHLRNLGRVQYTLFLKAIGIKPEEAVEFYREEFTKNIEESVFDNEYVYIFLHLYGLKGRGISHDVPSCVKMADVKSRRNEYHGCPMVTKDIDDLGQMLKSWDVDALSIRKIINLVKANQPTNACAEYFTAIHENVRVHPIKNPKDFYGQSVKIRGRLNCRRLAESEAVAGGFASTSAKLESSDKDEDSASDSDNSPLVEMDKKKLTIDEKIALMKKEILEFYKNAVKSKKPTRPVAKPSDPLENPYSKNLGESVPETLNVVDEVCYLNYISNYFEELEIGTMD